MVNQMSQGRVKLIGATVILVTVALAWRPCASAWCLHFANSALVNRRIDDAIHYLIRANQVDDTDAETLFLLARCYRLSGNFEKMSAFLTQAERLGYDKTRLRRERLLAYSQRGDLRQVMPHIGDMLKNPGEDGREICEALVSGLFLTWQFPQAMTVIEAWKRDFPNDAQPYLCLGKYYVDSRNLSKARECLEQAITIDSSRNDIRLELADVLLDLHSYDEAKKHYKLCVAQAPRDVRVLVSFASCLYEVAEVDAAKTMVDTAISIEPGNTKAQYLLAKILLAKNSPKEAITLAADAFAAMPFDPNIRYTYAATLMSLGRTEEASKHFEAIERQQQAQAPLRELLIELNNDPSRVDLRYKIGTTLLEFGNPQEGEAWLKSIFLFAPRHEEARAALDEYYKGLKKPNVGEARGPTS
jgi:tetratricopeptide (TPR) repeat protein